MQRLTSVVPVSWYVQYLITGHGIVTPGRLVQQSMTGIVVIADDVWPL